MTALARVFQYQSEHQVRTVLMNSEPWFVLVDVCSVLGIGNARQAAAGLDDDEVTTAPVTTTDGSSRTLATNVVSEAGLYSLILRSRKPEAKAFKRWITHNVLPEIRRTGAYIGTQAPAIPQSFAEALQLAADQAREIERQQAELEAAAPKVEAFDSLMSADGTYSMEAAAKALADVTGGWGRNKLFAYLRAERVLEASNLPYQRHAHWFRVVTSSYERSDGTTVPVCTTRVRPEGLDAIRKRLSRPRALTAVP